MSEACDSNRITREYFDSLLVETRYIDSDLPITEVELLGHKYSMPITTAALSHLHSICDNGMAEFALGAKNAGALCFIGMGEDQDSDDMAQTGADIVRIIKPLEDESLIYHKIDYAVKNGAVAVGMDIDHSYAHNGQYDNVFGLKMKSKTKAQLKAYVDYSPIPFVIKGVLSVSDALKAVEIGAKAIVVSHHHGIMPSSVPPLLVLPDIIEAVDGKLQIFVDCGISSGMDVFKALALGADAVCVGRDLMEPLKKGHDGVMTRMNELNDELKSIMARTGFSSLKEVDSSVIRYRNF